MQMQVRNQQAEAGSYVLRVSGEFAGHAGRAGPCANPQEQAEVRAPASCGALGDQLTHDIIGESIPGLVQRTRVDPDALQHGRGIHPKLEQQAWNREEWCNRYVLRLAQLALPQGISRFFDSRALRHKTRLVHAARNVKYVVPTGIRIAPISSIKQSCQADGCAPDTNLEDQTND